MPSKEELEASKAHFKKVDQAQESRLIGMFEELRQIEYSPKKILPKNFEKKSR